MTEDRLGRTYADGDLIFREGDVGETMYVIQSGRVRISKVTPSGDITVAILEEGAHFGEMALFDGGVRSATATALGEARVLTVDKRKLFATLNRDPTVVLKVIKTLSQRIRNLDEDLTKLKKEEPLLKATER